MTHGDGGKGSGRRKEDASKVRDNWDLIWSNKKQKEQPMIDEHDDGMDPQRSEDLEEQSDEWCCDVCGGPMYSAAHWNYGKCDDCGATQELINDDYI